MVTDLRCSLVDMTLSCNVMADKRPKSFSWVRSFSTMVGGKSTCCYGHSVKVDTVGTGREGFGTLAF